MDIVYVIYFDGKIYKNSSRKTAYLEEKNAKQVITQESKNIASIVASEDNKYWYDLSKEEEKEYINKAKKRFEIRKFVELKEGSYIE